ncbi:MAG TPA: hypothetical protein VGS20_02940 [Candidatus Acidoferrales bacterium]|nr:hypothetical protein [Candidatus Acidoferrales bacterium]
MAGPGRGWRFGHLLLLLAAVGLAATVVLAAGRQDQAEEQVNEIVANLASGHVTLFAAHDGVVVATIGSQFEPGNLPPLIVPMTGSELVVVLGAVDWVEPTAHQPLFRLDAALPGLAHGTTGNAPRLSAETGLSDPEQVALSVLEPLRAAARNLHAQLDLPADLPLAELVFVHQPTNESAPDIWDLSYPLKQTFLQQNFWDTEVERPRPIELYPDPENKNGLLEIRYPTDDRSPGLIDWLSKPAGRLLQDVQLDPKMAKAQQEIAGGDARKTRLAQLVPLVKMTLEAMAPASTGRAMAVLDWDRGFSWVIQPPTTARPQGPSRLPGAPTLKAAPHH